MVFRIFIEKKRGLDAESKNLLGYIKHYLSVEPETDLRLFERYDFDGLTREEFDKIMQNFLIDENTDNGFYDEFLGMVKDSDYIFVNPATLRSKIEYVDGVKCIIDYEYKTFYEEIQYKEPYYREYYDFIEEFIVKEEDDIQRKCYIDYEKYISALLSYESISNND